MENNYVHIEPNNHYYDDINQIINCIEHIKKFKNDDVMIIGTPIDLDHILIGLRNTIMNGYELKFNPNFNPDGNHHETGEKEL